MASKRKTGSPHRRLHAEMRQLGKRLDALMLATRRAEARVRSSSREQMRKLKAKQTLAKRRLAKLGRRSAAAGGPLKAGVRKAWRDIETAVKRATRRFRETA